MDKEEDGLQTKGGWLRKIGLERGRWVAHEKDELQMRKICEKAGR